MSSSFALVLYFRSTDVKEKTYVINETITQNLENMSSMLLN